MNETMLAYDFNWHDWQGKEHLNRIFPDGRPNPKRKDHRFATTLSEITYMHI